jgi:hypothetical protein
MKKQGARCIIDGADDALSFTVLWWSVGIRHPQKNPFGGEECARGSVIELTAIVALDDFDGATKLCENISEKFNKVEKTVRFNA